MRGFEDASAVLRTTVKGTRILLAVLGVIILLVAAYGLVGELSALQRAGVDAFSVRDAAAFVGLLAALMSGGLLLESPLTRLHIRLPKAHPSSGPRGVYGFSTILAIGVGSTLGCPLFILIPVNVLEYEIVSILSLLLAAILSIAMAKNNSDSYRILKSNGRAAVGGPAFVSVAVGARSARYFISRLTMAIANATLAAYCVLVFVLFVLGYLPALLQGLGLGTVPSVIIVALIIVLFATWFVMNSVYERRYIRVIGAAQVVFTSLLVAILVIQSYLLGSAGGWDLRGLLAFPAGSPLGWIAATILNTGYLYLLFFGFQEIQALDQEARDSSEIPIISQIWKGVELDKRQYFRVAMIATVVIASAVNIFYAIAVYAANPSPAGVSAAEIPSLYLAESILGGPQEALIAIAFLIAAFTTFVPAFLAATRHIRSMADDGFLPDSVARAAWLLVLGAIAILAAAGQQFLVSITDYMVLISLGIIALAALWLRRDRKKAVERRDSLAVGVALSCFVAAAALYVVTPSVAVFGSLAIAVGFLVYDLIELGSLGTRIFLALMDVVTFVLLSAYPRAFPTAGIPVLPGLEAASTGTDAIRLVVLLGGVMLVISCVVDVVMRRFPAPRTRPSVIEGE